MIGPGDDGLAFAQNDLQMPDLLALIREAAEQWRASPDRSLGNLTAFLQAVPPSQQEFVVMVLNIIHAEPQSSPLSMVDFQAWWEEKAPKLTPLSKWVLLMAIWPFVLNNLSNFTSQKFAELIFGHPTAASMPNSITMSRFSKGQGVRVHAAPGIEADILFELKRGQLVSVIRTEGDWTLIKTFPGGHEAEVIGWAKTEYLEAFFQ